MNPPTAVLPVALLGVSGRMGRAILAALGEFPRLKLQGAAASPTSRWIGADAGEASGAGPLGVRIAADAPIALRGCAVAIDFSLPEATAGNVAACVAAGVPIVLGTTGYGDSTPGLLDEASRRIPVLASPNMSLGVNLLLRLASLAAGALGEDFDIEIFEAHHRHKKDAPSGTALRLGEVVAAARNVSLDGAGVYDRHGATGPRTPGSIGFSVFRGGDVVGDHTVTFAGPGERIELTHRAHDRSGFARGALAAAQWLAGQSPGRYTLQDVLGLP